MTVNWHIIRIRQGSQDQGFEELCSQLFHNEPPAAAVAFERRGYRDAGLECAHVLRDGSLHGMQAKLFTRAPTADEWGQVDRSVRTAIAKNPKLRKLTICIPQNFDDPKIEGRKSAMDRWKEHRRGWESLAQEHEMEVEFELWDDTQLTSRLVRPENRGRLWYFFNREELTPGWFRSRVEVVAEDAKPRYTPEVNVELPIARLFEGLGRTEEFARTPREQQSRLLHALCHVSRSMDDSRVSVLVAEVVRLGEQLVRLRAESAFRSVVQLPLAQIASLAGAVEDQVYPAKSALEDLDRATEAEKRQEWEAAGKQGHFYHPAAYSDLRHHLSEVVGATRQLSAFAGSLQASLSNHPALLVSARAGKGKTHLFVDVALHRTALGLPTLVLLGENFRDADPLSQVIDLAGLHLDHDTFLQALEAAAEASGGRALLMIDALNEGDGMRLWPKRLGGLLKTLSRHPWIGIALSVRTTYEDVVVPETVSNTIVRTEHDGFASRPEEAARTFFAHYGINLPKIPLLNPELSDPLFLKLLCKGLHDEGLRDLPEGYEGVSRVFQFIVEATDRKLRRTGALDVPPHRKLVRQYLDRLADLIGESGGEAVPFETADRVSRELHPVSGYKGSLLELLLSEGLLSTEMVAGEARQEGVTLAYQRFRDHERARRLLAKHCDPHHPSAAFGAEGPIGQWFREEGRLHWERGLLEALSIQVPERMGLELVDLLVLPDTPEFSYVRDTVLGDCLLQSLLWRRKEAVTAATFEALERTCVGQHHDDVYLEVLLALAPVPDHPLNAERLHGILSRWSLPVRDEVWGEWLYRHRGEETGVDRLIAWAIADDDKSHLEDEAVLLACVALAWLTTSTVRPVRDRATKALVRMLTPRSHLMPRLLDRFAACDDPYVCERLYASSYGVALRVYDQQGLLALAEDTYQRLFAKEPVVPHVMVRDYGRCLIERAHTRGCQLSFDINKARPPYRSGLPSEPPSREYFKGLVAPSGEWTDRDRAISHVVDRFGSFEVSKYFGGPSLSNIGFSGVPLTEAVPLSRGQLLETWEKGLTERQQRLWQFVKAARRLGQDDIALYLRSLTDDELQEWEAQLRHATDHDATEDPAFGDGDPSVYDLAVQAFKTELSPEQNQVLEELVLVPGAEREGQVPGLDAELVTRWVIQRALELGWTAERFAEFDGSIERMKSRGWDTGAYDTMGCKYLWTAYYEVLARVADNYHAFKGYPRLEAAPFEGSWQLSLRTIDPSRIPSWRPGEAGDPGMGNWWLPCAYDIDRVRDAPNDWLHRSDDLPDAAQHLLLNGPDNTKWVALEAYPHYEQRISPDGSETEPPKRTMWIQLRGYLIRRQDADALSVWLSRQDFTGRWMPEAPSFHGLYLGELYEAPAWRALQADWCPPDWVVPDHECPTAVATVAADCSSPGDDSSLEGAAGVMVPSPLLLREAGLRWSGSAADWLSDDGTVVLQDPAARLGGRGALLIERSFLDRFLEEKGYALVWTVLGEKLVFNWDDRYPRLEFNGWALYSRGEFHERVSARYRGNEAD